MNTDYDIDSEIEMANELRTALGQMPVGDSEIAISLTEIEEAVRKCKKGKACGEDAIFYEHIIYL